LTSHKRERKKEQERYTERGKGKKKTGGRGDTKALGARCAEFREKHTRHISLVKGGAPITTGGKKAGGQGMEFAHGRGEEGLFPRKKKGRAK